MKPTVLLACLVFVLLEVPDALALAPAAQAGSFPQPVTAGHLEVGQGRLYYEVFGRGFPLVLIHDGLAHREVWDAQVTALADRYRIVRYDRRGYGLSNTPTAAYSNVEDLHALLDKLRVSRAVFVGSSAGGGLAIDYALEHGERVEALVLAGPVVSGLGYSFHFMKRGLANFGETDEESRARWIEDSYSVAPGNTAARARLRALLESSPQNLNLANYQLLKSPERPALERLSEISAPTLIVTAEHDIPDVHAHAGATEAGILGARRVVLDDAGHLSYLEQPAAFNHAVLEFLSLISIDPDSPRTLPALPEPWSSFSRGFVPVPGGALYYEEMGTGEPVILIHGGSIDHRMWDPQFPVLAGRYRVIRYDVRGHGLSRSADAVRRNYEDLGRLMEHLGIDSAHLVGLSLGGRIVVDFAIAHPERTLSLAAVSPGISGYGFARASEEEQEFFRTIGEAFQRRDWTEAAEVFLRAWTVGPRRGPEEVNEAVYGRVRRMAMEGMLPGKDTGENLELEPPALGRLGEITVPTLALLGDEDMPSIHEIVRLIDEQVPGSRKVVFEGAAHMLNMEQPERFNRLLLEFLQGMGRP